MTFLCIDQFKALIFPMSNPMHILTFEDWLVQIPPPLPWTKIVIKCLTQVLDLIVKFFVDIFLSALCS